MYYKSERLLRVLINPINLSIGGYFSCRIQLVVHVEVKL